MAAQAELESDESLMLSYIQGDIASFELLYRKHKGGLYRYFVRQIRDKQLAEDLYQETWSRVIRASKTYQVQAKFTTWLYKIAHNLLIDHVRAVKPLTLFSEIEEAQPAAIEPADPDAEPDHQLVTQLKAELLKQCTALLPSVQKEAFILSMETGLTASMISQIVEVSLEATKSRLRYAHQSIKACVAAKWSGVE